MPAKHAALVRGEDQNLHIRHFPSASDAARASGHLDSDLPDEDRQQPAEPLEPGPALLTQLAPVLPALVEQLREAAGSRVVLSARRDGGIEIELTRPKLYVSRRELAALLPQFEDGSDPVRFVDGLVAAGCPWRSPTGTKIFDLAKVAKWIERQAGHDGRYKPSP